MNVDPLPQRLALPQAPVLVAGVRQAAWLNPTGEVEILPLAEAAERLQDKARPVVCHARTQAARLRVPPFAAFDVLELYAFVRPARFALPTPRGLAQALGLKLPASLESEAGCLIAAAGALLAELADGADDSATAIAHAMDRGGWPWAPAVLAALGPASARASGDLRVWRRLDDWQERPPEGPPGNAPVDPAAARARLAELLGGAAEERPEQARYASATAAAFQPRHRADEPRLVIAEAGTGVGKTLGYIAPASLWAEANGGPVWISTFTRNLQRQLDGELDRLHPDPADKARHVVIRKGRENYFCLLNFEEALKRLGGGRGGQRTAAVVALGLMARWALATRDGDMVGGDFPAWLADLLGRGLTTDLTDTRGECIYSACEHYRKCFIEHTVRRARGADVVVANHALVMIQAALGGGAEGEEGRLPTRYVFDEGHHLFDAADAAFSAHLTARETAELRRWLIGAEEGSRSRSRGLKARIGDLIAGDKAATAALDDALRAARALPGAGWGQRLGGGAPVGAAEAFFARARQQVYARDPDQQSPYSLEAETRPTVPGLLEAAAGLDDALAQLAEPLARLQGFLLALLDTEADALDTNTRNRIEAVARGLERRGRQHAAAWRQMLKALVEDTPPEFVDWFGVERFDGRDVDVGLHRHWVDPTVPFAETVIKPAHGVLVTSASLRDSSGDAEADWQAALRRTGAQHLPAPAVRVAEPSPFDYAALTRVFVVGDVNRDDADQVAAAYRELFLAAGGGALGLFTAISRLKAVHQRIAGPLDDAGLMLLAQHVDVLDTGTLVDIFRAEENSCLLGTDAVRDGVDVPGRSLRLLVFDRVPWPRPDILHRARKRAFGGRAYDEMLTRFRLKQAFGRLVRRADDVGVFVMLDRALPTRLLGAFPEGVPVKRLGLKDAIAETRGFLDRGN
ncbi:MAG: ATP-dependent DNA helicase [Rhodospirillales bacterium]|nr:ATP-dependent DNA helicase [Rhodospirillales bacterium]